MGRALKLHIFRYNPATPDTPPHMETFQLEETDRMSLYIALNRIREEMDPGLQFDFSCRSGVCGSCGLLINGRPDLACHTLTKDLPEEITLLPLPVFKLIGDLSVDTGVWFRDMHERIGSWIHTPKSFDPAEPEAQLDNRVVDEIYDIDRCIECGCCVAACEKSNMRPDFMGPVTFNRIVRFMVDPRDERSMREFYEVVGTDEGIFGCLGLLACEDICPKGVKLQDQLSALRRKMGWSAVMNLFGKVIPVKQR
jgi:fumarate reductase iron-sulfur subunit